MNSTKTGLSHTFILREPQPVCHGFVDPDKPVVCIQNCNQVMAIIDQ